jgi:HAMP domain-containing protein
VDVSNVIVTDKQSRRFGAAMYAKPAQDIIRAADDACSALFSDMNIPVLEPALEHKRVYVVYANAAATAATPMRVAVSIANVGDHGLKEPPRILMDLRFLDEKATGWQSRVAVPLAATSTAPTEQEVSASQRRVDRLIAIQAKLGLPVQTLATILRISRPALYKWLDVEDDVQPQAENRERLAAVERIAQRWNERSVSPMSSVAHEPLSNGSTVLGLLTAEELDEGAVVGALDELVQKLQAKPKSLSQKMADAGYTRRPSRRSLSDDE